MCRLKSKHKGENIEENLSFGGWIKYCTKNIYFQGSCFFVVSSYNLLYYGLCINYLLSLTITLAWGLVTIYMCNKIVDAKG